MAAELTNWTIVTENAGNALDSNIAAAEWAPAEMLQAVHLSGLTLADRVAELQQTLPAQHEPYTDKYFLRSAEVLRQLDINPFIRAQVMVRQGPGEVGGLEEAIALITKHSRILENGGRIYALDDGDSYDSRETLLLVECRVQDLIELETEYLGVISEKTSKANGLSDPDLDEVTARTRTVVEAAEGRPVIYMGARHWSFRQDEAIARAAFAGGAAFTSTDIGAAVVGKSGVGTIPHALENVMASIHGRERAVVEATKAFDRVISKDVPRIALIDYNNREISDSITTARELDGALSGVRVDTCGENLAEGAIPNYAVYASLRDALRQDDPIDAEKLLVLGAKELSAEQRSDTSLVEHWIATVREFEAAGVEIGISNSRFWFGKGVTVSGVLALRGALNDAGFSELKIVLSSGFAEVAKIEAFTAAEKLLNVRLFDVLGVGGVFESRAAKMDIVAVADRIDELDAHPIAKQGRGYSPNPRLKFINPALEDNRSFTSQHDTLTPGASADAEVWQACSLAQGGAASLHEIAFAYLAN